MAVKITTTNVGTNETQYPYGFLDNFEPIGLSNLLYIYTNETQYIGHLDNFEPIGSGANISDIYTIGPQYPYGFLYNFEPIGLNNGFSDNFEPIGLCNLL